MEVKERRYKFRKPAFVRYFDNILIQFTVSLLLILIVISVFLGIILTRWTADLQIRKHIDLYPEIIKQEIYHYPEISSYFEGGTLGKSIPEFGGFVDSLKSFGSIFRVKIWGEGETILWSDERELIGKKFPDDTDVINAWGGELKYNVSKPQKSEQKLELNHSNVLELYVPIIKDQKTIAVFEIYEATDTLFAEIQTKMVFIWLFIGFAGLFLYIILFYIYYRAYMKQKEINIELSKTQDVTIFALAYQAELRDHETGNHILRTAEYVRVIVNALKNNPKYRRIITEKYIEDIVKAAPLHDIGKVGVADSILLKPGRLTPEEFEVMKKHSEYGAHTLEVAKEKLGFKTFLDIAIDLVFYHHEKWDGSGYPNGYEKENIPLSARVMALADVFDALTSKRHYKEAFSYEKAKAIIIEGKGKHFDPDVVEAFLQNEQEFKDISKKYADKT